jgi:hypothetical protein
MLFSRKLIVVEVLRALDDDLLLHVAADDEDLVDAGGAIGVDLPLQDRASVDLDQRLRPIVGVGRQAPAHAGRDDDRFHVSFLTMPRLVRPR